jgi:hypothetical protein
MIALLSFESTRIRGGEEEGHGATRYLAVCYDQTILVVEPICPNHSTDLRSYIATRLFPE